MVRCGQKALWCVIFLSTLAVGCATGTSLSSIARYEATTVMAPVGTTFMDKEEVQRVLAEVEQHNREVEDSPEWVKRAYSGLMVRRLTNVSEGEYLKYREYLDDGVAYVLVHPSFFPFFHYPKKLVDNTSDKLSRKNVVEQLLEEEPASFEYALLQAQERRMRDFIEFKSTQEKLLIIVVPRNYHRYSGYTYKRGRDEYMRYLNEITNLSPSVLFVESRSPNRGYLTEEDAVKLMEFLGTIDAESIYVGGGYVGRCLEDFYALLTEEYGSEGIFVVPEISDISPREINRALASALLQSDGGISVELATNVMKRDVYRVQETVPILKNLE
jgi:hypothetical protein